MSSIFFFYLKDFWTRLLHIEVGLKTICLKISFDNTSLFFLMVSFRTLCFSLPLICWLFVYVLRFCRKSCFYLFITDNLPFEFLVYLTLVSCVTTLSTPPLLNGVSFRFREVGTTCNLSELIVIFRVTGPT